MIYSNGVTVVICSGKEKETWKGWEDSRSGACSVCELMIAMNLATYYSQELAGVNSSKNGTQKSFYDVLACVLELLTFHRHTTLWKDISNHLDGFMVQQRLVLRANFVCFYIPQGHSIHCL